MLTLNCDIFNFPGMKSRGMRVVEYRRARHFDAADMHNRITTRNAHSNKIPHLQEKDFEAKAVMLYDCQNYIILAIKQILKPARGSAIQNLTAPRSTSSISTTPTISVTSHFMSSTTNNHSLQTRYRGHIEQVSRQLVADP